MTQAHRPIAIFYEHPHWFRPLFAELERRHTPHVRIDATHHTYDAASGDGKFSLLFNRMSPSAYRRGHGNGIFYTLNYLAHLERAGTRVVNGYRAFQVEISKALQAALLEQLGLPYPATRVINHPAELIAAAEGLRYPLLLKPNVGGSGAGVRRYNTPEALSEAAASDIDFGLDGTALLQEFIPARGNHITRLEVLGGKYLYAINVFLTGETFDLCPADICKTTAGADLLRAACAVDAPKSGISVEATQPSAEAIADVERIMQAANIEVGGVEYIVDDRDGRRLYYDINALSNFVADAQRVLGFDPHARLADYLEREAQR